MGNSYLPGRYTDPEFYRQPYVVERLKKLGIERGSVKKAVAEEVEFGLLDTAGLRKISLLDAASNPLGTLLAKFYTPSKRKGRVHISPLARGIEQDISFRFENLKFQNNLGLPTPVVVCKGTYSEIAKELSRTKKEEPTYVLLMDYWEGPTLDMDVMAIRRAIDMREKELTSGKFVREEHKEKLSSEIDTLRKTLREDLISRALDTLVDLSTETTDVVEDNGFRLPGTKIKVNRGENPYKFFIGKRRNQFKSILYWNLIQTGKGSIDDIFNLNTVLKPPQRWDCFEKLMDPLKKHMFLEGRNVYSQGDEHLHHFKRRKFVEDSDEVRVGIFDMGSIRMEDPLFGVSRVLSSYLLNLERDEAMEIFGKRFRDFVAKYKPGVDRTDIELAFELFTLIETMWGISRRAHDITFNKAEYDTQLGKFRERRRKYENLRLPLADPIELPETLGYGLYNAPVAIGSNKKRMKKLIRGLIEDVVGYYRKPELEDPLKRLEEFLEKNVIKTKV